MLHDYLRAIGFASIENNQKLYEILEDIVKHPEGTTAVADTYGNELGIFWREFGTNMGICVLGNFYSNNEFHIDYYFPYLKGSNVSTYSKIEVEKYTNREGFAGICDDFKLGLTLIFHANNVGDIIRTKRLYGTSFVASSATLSGLGLNGRVLLPVEKSEKNSEKVKDYANKRTKLLKQAREGDQNAIDSLTIEDMDIYSKISRRVTEKKEDILSIVESSFMPYGVESEQYVIIGEILSCYVQTNTLTSEVVWIMALDVSGLKFDIAINEKDLYGEPEIGRRFRGRIYLEGIVNVM